MAVFLAGTLVVVVLLSVAAYALGYASSPRGELARDRFKAKLTHRTPELPTSRPIEKVASDLRRLGDRYHSLHPHAPFAKVEAVRGAYDKALGECCSMLGATHLLDVLPVGAERDVERERVEDLLGDRGVRLRRAA